MPREMVEIKNVECLKETGAAILCKIGEDEVWIPRSQLGDDSHVNEEGDVGTLEITEWIAIEKNLV